MLLQVLIMTRSISFSVVLVLLFSNLSKISSSLVGYRCGSEGSNLTAISLVTKPQCQIQNLSITHETRRLVLTQVLSTGNVKFDRCLVTATHLIYDCGTFYDTLYEGGFYTEVLSLSRDECNQLANQGYIDLYGVRVLTKKGQTTEISLTTHGYIHNSKCTPGIPLTHGSQVWSRPVRVTSLKIIATSGEGVIDFEENKIILPGSIKCQYTEETCFHHDLGNIFWTIDHPGCETEKPMSVLYSGLGTVVTRDDGALKSMYIQVQEGTTDFQIMLSQITKKICGFTSLLTEHPKLFVTLLPSDVESFPGLSKVSSKNADLMLYINSKLVYSMRNTHWQVDKLFKAFQNDRCVLEQKILDNYLTLATIDPVAFAYQYFGRPGFTAVVRGEVIYLSQCSPVVVTPITTPGICYNELPVVWNNRTFFLSPRNRLIIEHGKIVDCVPGIETAFLLGQNWYQSTSIGLQKVPAPQTVTMEFSQYVFDEITTLANGGLYTEETIGKLQRVIMSPISENIVTSRLVTSMEFGTTLPQGYTVSNTLTTSELQQMTIRAGSFFTGLFQKTMDWGLTVASIWGLYFTGWLALRIISSVFNFKKLFKEFGLATAMLFFWCDSLTSHIMDGSLKPPRRGQEQGETLQDIFCNE